MKFEFTGYPLSPGGGGGGVLGKCIGGGVPWHTKKRGFRCGHSPKWGYNQKRRIGTDLYKESVLGTEVALKGAYVFIISPNEVFGDIMVLASPLHCPPVDPDNVNTVTQKIFNLCLSNFKRG